MKTIMWVRWVAFVAAVGLVTACANGQERPSEPVSTPHSPPAPGLDRSAGVEPSKRGTLPPELHSVTAGASTKADGKDCGRSYGDTGYVTNPATRWTTFTDIVHELTARPDGSAVVAFRLSSRRYEIPKGADAAFLKVAEVSLKDKSEVHVAVQEGERKWKRPGGVGTTGELPKVHWIDAKKQHPSCAPEFLLATASGGITAHFGGEKPPSDMDVPLEFGVTALWFTFPGDESAYVFKPAGDLYFSDWRFDIFAPDGAHVLLLQDRFGPYHVVKTDSLKNYLLGAARPDHVVTGARKPGEPARVHSEGRWVSPREIRFTAACCGTSETIAYQLR